MSLIIKNTFIKCFYGFVKQIYKLILRSPSLISVGNAGGEYSKVVDTVHRSKARNHSLMFWVTHLCRCICCIASGLLI